MYRSTVQLNFSVQLRHFLGSIPYTFILQVKTVMSLLPPNILARGREVTSNILNQIQEGHKKTGYNVPFQ